MNLFDILNKLLDISTWLKSEDFRGEKRNILKHAPKVKPFKKLRHGYGPNICDPTKFLS